jgi:hypothetical protein
MLKAAGRERGPDIVLNVEKGQPGHTAATAAVNGIITSDSSITEVLNIVAYLTIPTGSRDVPANPIDARWFNKEHSVVDAAGNVPGPSNTNGFYDTNALAHLDNSLFVRGGGRTQILYNLDTMAFEAAGAIAGGDVIPVCIRRRDAPTGTPLMIGQVADTTAAAASGIIPAGPTGNVLVTSLMSDCVKQMINILENTRTIFGPKGWTALFSKVKGGGAKRTHRQHRRRYSSKHY